MKMTGQFASAALKTGEHRTTVILDVFGEHTAELESFGEKVLDIELKVHREKRSTKANALCWELCSQIGRAITPPMPKEDVYRDAIRAVGEYDQYYIKEEALDSFMETRKLLGVGWFAEVIGDAPLRGWVEVFAYKGSSTYDTKAMSTLIDYLVDQAEQMELQIAYDLREIERIKEDWASDLV
ncbi:MAG: hypothetical protein IJH25_08510 [Clostridia bacterium]|nr:hypothetical protein [Clostridia bacterium]MBQ6121536.1 hypothetical protein [Clostridia bacterium]